MLFSSFIPQLTGRTLPDAKADHKAAEKIGPCRLSSKAFYLPDHSYVLTEDIRGGISDMGTAHVTGCCAGGVPVPRVIVITDAKKIPFLCDNKAAADKIAEALNALAGK